jgi:hypothetical protein
LGQGATASEGISEIDLSGTNIVIRSNFVTFGAGLLFRNSATNALSGTSIGSAFDNFDGLGRDDRVRYDSPTFAGFQISGSALQGDSIDVALRYSADLDGTKVAAGVALAHLSSTSTTIDTQLSGSVSVLLENGFNATVAGGMRDVKGGTLDDPVFYYVKLGYRASMFDIGKTSFASRRRARTTSLLMATRPLSMALAWRRGSTTGSPRYTVVTGFTNWTVRASASTTLPSAWSAPS